MEVFFQFLFTHFLLCFRFLFFSKFQSFIFRTFFSFTLLTAPVFPQTYTHSDDRSRRKAQFIHSVASERFGDMHKYADVRTILTDRAMKQECITNTQQWLCKTWRLHIQSYLCKTKSAQEAQCILRKLLRPEEKPKIHLYGQLSVFSSVRRAELES